jgi:hypothetical protein
MKTGDKVYFGRTHGERTLGEIVKVNRTTVQVRQLETRGAIRERPVGTVWKVPFALCTPIDAGGNPAVTAMHTASRPMPPFPPSKRAEDVILVEIGGIYCGLSPENLSCDGELTRAEMGRKAAMLNRRLAALFAELGRRVTEEETYPALERQRDARNAAVTS